MVGDIWCSSDISKEYESNEYAAALQNWCIHIVIIASQLCPHSPLSKMSQSPSQSSKHVRENVGLVVGYIVNAGNEVGS